MIAANNLYDAEYVLYFTGSTAIYTELLRLPSRGEYAATRPGFILAPIHNGGWVRELVDEDACGFVSEDELHRRTHSTTQSISKLYVVQ